MKDKIEIIIESFKKIGGNHETFVNTIIEDYRSKTEEKKERLSDIKSIIQSKGF